ncbi:hypothetical protein OG264_03220 [Streptomyces xanthophaeus]|uniref:hypothetical protein n=1 Tax=Streptomyces xanthophaeus TaxID=67385 RepID=UPI0038659A36|nr:hypothetical protein OG264_03220 [Streptomyces xanthophaeus]WST64417.1 hypothetical protein OG605_35140 [Streptomyces xanthophaeus]
MQNHDENARRASEPALTTEDLAHPAQPADDRQAAVFPGEATGQRSGGTGREADLVPEPGREGTDLDAADRDAADYGAADRGAADRDAADLDAAGRQTGPGTGLGPEPVARDTAGTPGPDEHHDDEPLLGAAEAERYRTTWSEIQGRFVDDPQEAVRSADTLVAEVMQAFAGTLSEHRSGLEKQWDRGEQVATEDLRQALRAYRSLVNRLLDT